MEVDLVVADVGKHYSLVHNSSILICITDTE